MCRAQCVLALVAMYVGLAHSSSWDFATSSGTDLEFYFRGKHTYTEHAITDDMRKITYDPVGIRMFFYDYKDDFNYIFSFDMTTKKTAPLVLKTNKHEVINGIAYDPVEQILFWSAYMNQSIYWLSLKSRFENAVYGNFLINTNVFYSTIAIDNCNGYIYWTSIDDETSDKLPYFIERARFDGSGRELVIITGLLRPECLVIDPQTQRLYWTEGIDEFRSLPYRYFSIESSDLNGNNRTVIYHEPGQTPPQSLAVSEDSIFWSHWDSYGVWQLPKIPSIHAKPKKIPTSAWSEIVTNYKIEKQLQGVQDCDRLKSLLQNDTMTVENNSVNVAADTYLDCVHGTRASGESQCKCENGYVGEKCDVSLCHNYCFQGNCSVSDEGEPQCRCDVGYSGQRCEVNVCQGYCLNTGECSSVSNEGEPQCRCDAGYSGQRCEVNVCQGYCLNAGECSLNEENAPVCQCRADFEGERCEVSACLNRLNKHFQTVSMLRDVLNADSPGILDRGVKSTCAANIF